MEKIFWPLEWDFLPYTLDNFRGIIMVVAPVDRGKTTLVRLLSSFFVSRGRKVGWVDSDLGQSNVGPPTTVGMVAGFRKFSSFSSREVIHSLFPIRRGCDSGKADRGYCSIHC